MKNSALQPRTDAPGCFGPPRTAVAFRVFRSFSKCHGSHPMKVPSLFDTRIGSSEAIGEISYSK